MPHSIPTRRASDLGEGYRKLLVAIDHPRPARADALKAAFDSAGFAVQLLPQHVDGLRAWVDSCFDLLLVNPFLDWQEPFEFVRLARSIAGRRPLLVVSDRNSLGDRMAALSAGAADAFGWTNNLPELLPRIAGTLRRTPLAPGHPGPGAPPTHPPAPT